MLQQEALSIRQMLGASADEANGGTGQGASVRINIKAITMHFEPRDDTRIFLFSMFAC
jgi:hypothetical protein